MPLEVLVDFHLQLVLLLSSDFPTLVCLNSSCVLPSPTFFVLPVCIKFGQGFPVQSSWPLPNLLGSLLLATGFVRNKAFVIFGYIKDELFLRVS